MAKGGPATDGSWVCGCKREQPGYIVWCRTCGQGQKPTRGEKNK